MWIFFHFTTTQQNCLPKDPNLISFGILDAVRSCQALNKNISCGMLIPSFQHQSAKCILSFFLNNVCGCLYPASKGRMFKIRKPSHGRSKLSYRSLS